MTAPQMTIVDVVTGETTTRNLTAKELTEIETDKAQTETQAAAKLAKIAQRKAVLDKLGLTADEADALFG
jgi:hypothetical protein